MVYLYTFNHKNNQKSSLVCTHVVIKIIPGLAPNGEWDGIFSGIGGIAELAEIAKLLYQTTQEHYTLAVGRLCS